MKAAILYKAGETPKYGDFPEPIVGDDEVIIYVKAASIKNIDRMRAKGTHYDQHHILPAVVGIDGVGSLADGTRVYTGSPKGMMAEKAIVNKHWMIRIPDTVDYATAAALPNPAVSAWLALEWKGQLKAGGKVLIIGATGTTGKLAVQIAKHLGAGKVVALGRNPLALRELKTMGADVVLSLAEKPDSIKNALRSEIKEAPFDVVIDYLWGQPAEIVFDAIAGYDLNAVAHLTRYIQVGEMAGATLALPAATLRSSLIEISGLGGGGIPGEILKRVQTELLPKIFELAGSGLLTIQFETAPLKDIGRAWIADTKGKRLVIIIG